MNFPERTSQDHDGSLFLLVDSGGEGASSRDVGGRDHDASGAWSPSGSSHLQRPPERVLSSWGLLIYKTGVTAPAVRDPGLPAWVWDPVSALRFLSRKRYQSHMGNEAAP